MNQTLAKNKNDDSRWPANICFPKCVRAFGAQTTLIMGLDLVIEISASWNKFFAQTANGKERE